jgi:hexulose-6-phosphate isomerase
VQALQQIAETAEHLKVTLAVEFVWNGFLFSPLEMKHFLDEVGSAAIGFYFDPGNMAVFQYPHHWVRIVGKHIKMVHLKDWKGRALNGGWTPLLEGEVDYAAMNRELRAIGYDGPMISEVPPKLASFQETADAIRKIIQIG